MEEDHARREAFVRLAAGVDEFEGYTHPHAERLAKLADETAKLFGLGHADRASLRLAALAHDFGEAAMKRDYLKRAGPLTEDERLDLARHPIIGEHEAARAGADRGAQLLVRWHHECWNGTGYPDALRGDQIPLAARLLRVADAYVALTDARPFRPAYSVAAARSQLTQGAGLEFDPHVVAAFLTLRDLPELRAYATDDKDAERRAPAVPVPGSTATSALPAAAPSLSAVPSHEPRGSGSLVLPAVPTAPDPTRPALRNDQDHA